MNRLLAPCRLAVLMFVTVLAGQSHGASPAPLGPITEPLWLRYSAISPDGREIAFAFQGNLFVVPTEGGVARLLVGNGHHSFAPVWSADGRSIAYASDTNGNFDVYVVAASGGPSRRLTMHSVAEIPLSFTPDGNEVLFSASRMDSRTNLQFPSRAVSELYKVSVAGGKRPTQIFSTPALSGWFNSAGTQLIYEDWKGYENAWRKHHISPVARDIWLYDARSGQHRQLSRFGGEDRNPVWSPDEQSVYFLSEKSGSFNVWRMPLSQPEAATQVTNFTKNPVRFLSVAKNGMLSFGYDGELYTLAPGASEPKKVSVQIAADTRVDRIEQLKLSEGATEIAVSPNGQELAFIVRGEVFVASTEFGDTRRITNTAAQERSLSFSPDGRRIAFAAEREGSWNLYEARLPGKKQDQPYFFSAANVRVETLLKNGKENFQPRYSPDGKELAFLEGRTTLKVLDIASGKSREVMPGSMSYSYIDGDQWFDWSPDGKWLLVNFIDRNRWSGEVGLIDARGKEPLLNLTKSGYEDYHPVFTDGGKSMLWYSDRMGLHGTGGAAQQDLLAMFFTQEAFDRFNLEKSAFAQLKKQEQDEDKEGEEDGAKAKGVDKKKSEDKDVDSIKLPEPIKVEREGLEDRIVRVTPNSGALRAAVMSPDGETVFYLVQSAEAYELWSIKLRQKVTKKVIEFPAGKAERGESDNVDLQLDAKGENGFALVRGGIKKFKVPKEEGEIKVEPMAFNATMSLDRAAERQEMFEHIWRQTREKHYVADMDNVDWAYYRQVYARQLPFIADNYDFAEAMSEMLGELNVSHTGSGYRSRRKDTDQTAALGAFYDEAYRGAGLKIAEVIEGGPLVNAKVGLKAGMVIEKIDGVAITADAEFDSLLNHKAGQRIELTVLDPTKNKRFETVVKPIAINEQQELLYKRWIKTERELVEKLSNGRVGYVHVRGMDDDSYRQVYSEVLGRHSGKEALIVDTRFNGGGNLHDELATFLSGKAYLEYLPRGQSLGWEPTGKWVKPSVVLMGESNYSDAHLFPWVYRKLGIGKLIGMPVAGTGTAVWWETLQDDSLFFGIPEVGFRDSQGEFMEKALIEPDLKVAQDPAQLAGGRDLQLEAAVNELLKRR